MDVYQPCLCGSDKKIKFCCCRDITSDLDRLERMLGGGQRAAGLDLAEKLIAKHGQREAMLAIKAQLQMELDQSDKAEQTAAALLEKAPDNPVGLSITALLLATRSGALAGIEPLQRIFQSSGDSIHHYVYEVIFALSQFLLAEGHFLSAVAHLRLHALLGGQEDLRAMKLLVRMFRAPEIPFLLKQEVPLMQCPPEASWKAEFDTATELAMRGAWRAAAERLTALRQQVPNEPCILMNIALALGPLGDQEATAAALQEYVALGERIPLDDAVDAEALRQLLQFNSLNKKTMIDVQNVVYSVTDVDALMEQFRVDRRTAQLSVDLSQPGGQDEPPPKAVFFLLDRELPETGIDIALENVPRVLAELHLYGRQTDRPARLEADLPQNDQFEANNDAIVQAAKDLIDPTPQMEVVGQASPIQEAMTFRPHMPDDTPPEHRLALQEQQRPYMIFQRWPEIKLPVLGGRTPNEAAAEPACRVPLLAAILNLELDGQQQRWNLNYNELRTQLGLPANGTIDPQDVIVWTLPLSRLSRLAADKLSDQQLVEAYRRAELMGAAKAIDVLGRELVGRDSIGEDSIYKDEVYGRLAAIVSDFGQALSMLAKARQAAKDRGQSPARWLLAQLPVHLQRGDIKQFQQVMQEIQHRHINEPGISGALMDILVRLGLVQPDGTPNIPPPDAVPAQSAGPDEPAAGQIWTPGESPSSAQEASGQEKSKIWVPGMD